MESENTSEKISISEKAFDCRSLLWLNEGG